MKLTFLMFKVCTSDQYSWTHLNSNGFKNITNKKIITNVGKMFRNNYLDGSIESMLLFYNIFLSTWSQMHVKGLEPDESTQVPWPHISLIIKSYTSLISRWDFDLNSVYLGSKFHL